MNPKKAIINELVQSKRQSRTPVRFPTVVTPVHGKAGGGPAGLVAWDEAGLQHEGVTSADLPGGPPGNSEILAGP